jgi:SAM-dependent methyltransferase
MMNPAEFANIAQAERDSWWYSGMRRILFGVLDPMVEQRCIRTVLEAGCGTGYNAAAFQHRYGWQAYPMDLQRQGLAYAQAMGLTRLAQGDLAALPYRTGAFDAVVSLDVLVHFPQGSEGRALAEVSRVLAPGGLLVLRVAALEALRSRHSQYVCERQRFTSQRLVCALRDHGIRMLRSTYANMLLLPVALIKFRLWEPLMRCAPQSGVRPVSRWLNALLAGPLALESRWLQAGRNLPVGQSLILIGEREK